jgi:leucyl-tRNA synthetase
MHRDLEPSAKRNHASSELRMQDKWKQAGIFQSDPIAGRPKWFVVELPPFANGKLHLGHLRNYAIGDVIARFRRMAGYNVLYTTGFDAFGLPNENAAREARCAPAKLVEHNMAEMLRQFSRLGLSYDPRRIISDHEPRYYRWVQWMFLKLMAAGHIYRRKGLVNWCAGCRSTLAESLVEAGRCWRCSTTVGIVEMERWYVREVDFVAPLLTTPPPSGWPEMVTRIHRDWIGARDGIEVTFDLAGRGDTITAFTSTPELLADTAFLGIGPLHPLGAGAPAGRVVDLGILAIEPLSRRPVPVVLVREDDRVIEDDVLLGCPAREERDQAIWRGVCRDKDHALVAPAAPIERQMITWRLQDLGCGRPTTRYRLRDWDIARPRYWGTPVPVVHCMACGPVPVPVWDLPVLLPDVADLDTPGSPLAEQPSFVEIPCPTCRRPARRDTDTIETYASPWWFYLICKDPEVFSPFDPNSTSQWMPVDVMIGGADQSRTCFFHLRVLAEAMTRLGIVNERFPVKRLIAIGMVKSDGRKMSKSAGNAVDLAAMIDRFGADALRLAILSAAAPDQDVNWSDDLPIRASRFVNNLIRLFARNHFAFAALPAHPPDVTKRQRQFANKVTIAERKITGNLERYAFHLAIQQLIFFHDQIVKFEQEQRPGDEIALGYAARSLLQLAAPLAPHVAEELWELGGGIGLIAATVWPQPISATRCAETKQPEGIHEGHF